MKKVVLATATFYKSMMDVRFQCALKTMQEAKRCGYAIICVDGSPNVAVVNAFRKAGAVVFPQTSPGMGGSRREVIRYALGTIADVIIWIEPEKYPIVSLLAPCIEMVASGGYDLVIPRRHTLTGYPFYQHWSEMEGNWRISEITGRPDLDLYVGPRVMNRKVAELFLEYEGDPYGDLWQSLFIVVLRALAKGMNIGSRTVNYIHPPEQTAEEQDSEVMNRKRDEQRVVLIDMMTKEAALLGIKSALTL